MLDDILSIGWRPTLIGLVTLIVAAVAGSGMGADRSFVLTRWVRRYLESLILPVMRHRLWVVRSFFIFANNASICALVILAGRWPAGAWAAIVVVGLTMGTAIRVLGERATSQDAAVDDVHTEKPDALVSVGLWLNLLEVPAILATLGMSMGRLALPNGVSNEVLWRIYVLFVLPALLVAAGGEGLWIGRHKSTFLM